MINDINFNSKHYDTCKFAIQFIHLVIICSIFPLNFVQYLPTMCIAEKLEWNISTVAEVLPIS